MTASGPTAPRKRGSSSFLQDTKLQTCMRSLEDHLVEPSGLSASHRPVDIPTAVAEKGPYWEISACERPRPRLEPVPPASSSPSTRLQLLHTFAMEVSNQSEKQRWPWLQQGHPKCLSTEDLRCMDKGVKWTTTLQIMFQIKPVKKNTKENVKSKGKIKWSSVLLLLGGAVFPPRPFRAVML